VNTLSLQLFELISPKSGHICTWPGDILIRLSVQKVRGKGHSRRTRHQNTKSFQFRDQTKAPEYRITAAGFSSLHAEAHSGVDDIDDDKVRYKFSATGRPGGRSTLSGPEPGVRPRSACPASLAARSVNFAQILRKANSLQY